MISEADRLAREAKDALKDKDLADRAKAAAAIAPKAEEHTVE